jgi:predicted RND superfamily exporter protein
MYRRVITWFHRASCGHLEWIYRTTTGSPRTVIIVFMLAVLLSALSISQLRFDTNIFNLFPSQQPALKLLLDSLEWSGSAGDAYFLLEGDKQQLPAEAGKFAQRLQQARVDGKPAFKRITWQIYDDSQASSFIDLIGYAASNPQLFVQQCDVPALINRFKPDQVSDSLRRLQSSLASQFAGEASGLAAVDPLFLRDLILPRFKVGSQALDLDPASPYFISRDGTLLIMIAEPSRPVQDMDFARKLVTAINQARSNASVSITCTGAHISAVLDEQAMKSNILISIVSSLLVVLGIFYSAYRRLLPTLLIPLILVCGVVMALGAVGLFARSIHIISFAFTALITGIGTDYSIHLYDRFHSERAVGRSTEEALRLAVLNTGHGVFTAAITTGLPFLALCVSDVRALSELGVLVGLGVVFSLYASLFFLPPLLLFMDRHFPISYRSIPGLGLDRVWLVTQRCPSTIIVLSILTVSILGWCAGSVRFDGELKNLQPRHSEAFIAQERIERHLSLAPRHLLVAVEGTDLGDVLARAERVGGLAADLQQQGEITAWSSLGRIINSRPVQAQILGQLNHGFEGKQPGSEIRRQLDQEGFSSDGFDSFLAAADKLGQAVPIDAAQAIAKLSASPMRGIVDRHLARDASGYHALVYLHYRSEAFHQESFLAKLRALDPTVRVSSVDLVSDQLSMAVKQSFIQAFALGGALVLFLLLVHFAGTPTGILYSLTPVLAGSVCMLGAMALTGMRLNFMNAMVLVTILGMGSDFGLYIRFRVTAETEDERQAQFVQIGRSVLLSAMTTIVGFGSLAFTDYGAMSSIGWATNLGVGFTTIFCLITIPAVMTLWRAKSRRS